MAIQKLSTTFAVQALVPIAPTAKLHDQSPQTKHWLRPLATELRSNKEIIASTRLVIPASLQRIATLSKALAFHGKTLWLFIADDTKAILPTWIAFALIHATRLSQFNAEPVTTQDLISRIPHILTWTLLHLLFFTIGNQRRPGSILEDTLSKPYRPIAAKRISPKNAETLQTAVYLACLLFSITHGGLISHLVTTALCHLYNDLGGGTQTWLARNLINGVGNLAYCYGALDMACGTEKSPMTVSLACWLGVLALAISSTSHMQDLKDQAGDRAAGTRTVPLIYGDGAARSSLVGAMVGWTAVCCGGWAKTASAHAGPVLLAVIIAWRALRYREARQDRLTQKLWNLWMLALFAIPMMNSPWFATFEFWAKV